MAWLDKLKAGIRKRRLVKTEAMIATVKVIYHTFRILLANNERALDVLTTIDVRTRSSSSNRSGLADQVKELLDVTFELVDGLYRMDSSKCNGLFPRYNLLAGKIGALMEPLSVTVTEPADCLMLSEITPDLKHNVGGKAAALALLQREGLPIPAGFVVTTKACVRFLKEAGLDLAIKHKLRLLNTPEVTESEFDKTASAVASEIMQAKLPPILSSALAKAYQTLRADKTIGVAVRSSANVEDTLEHSFAGQFETVLNVRNFEDLTTAFKKVLASNFNARVLSYRKQVGLPLIDFEMAVLCLEMIEAHSAGVLFTVDPGSHGAGRMLISAVPGLGISAVGGDYAADLYYPSRSGPNPEDEFKIAEKSKRLVCSIAGGLEEITVADSDRQQPLLTLTQLQKLVGFGLMVESRAGRPQDIEWAINARDELFLLQARPLRIPTQIARMMEVIQGKPLLSGGVAASAGRVVGRIKLIRGLSDFEQTETGPRIMVLYQSSVDAARWLSSYAGVIVEIGNPADHLSCVARENSRPMLTGMDQATKIFKDGQLVVLDADRLKVMEASESIWSEVEASWRLASAKARRISPVSAGTDRLPELETLRSLIVQLNLTDAYGPTFNILECQSLHDIIRYVHEMAILSMFDVGDRILFGGGMLYRLATAIPFYFQIIDLGGGMVPGLKSSNVELADIASTPFLALWDGIITPGIRWSGPPANANLAGLMSKSLLDGRSARPVGCMNYVLLAYDYINLNARMDYHFTMLDSVCSANSRDNYVRFRFKGGGTSQTQRERRSIFIDAILRENGFFTCVNGDMVTGTLTGASKETIKQKLVMIGRLLGFSRLMDAAMVDDDSPAAVVKAFLDGNYSLEPKPQGHSPV